MRLKQTLKLRSEFFEAYEDATEGEQIALIAMLINTKATITTNMTDLLDYVNQTALSWDHVEADGKEAGYYRLQFSWGGPSDECRIILTLLSIGIWIGLMVLV